MSDELKHECGVALLAFHRPPALPGFGLEQMSLLLEKQHNRGQDGAGLGVWQADAVPGIPYFKIFKSNGCNPLATVLENSHTASAEGDILLGHLRYGTFGNNNLEDCHPLLRESACRNRALMLAGNFNLTNSRALLQKLTLAGHHLTSSSDTAILLHCIGHELEKNPEQPIEELLRNAAKDWDGGFLICGVIGDGKAFALRDAAGIRPGFYYTGEAETVVASERPPIQTAFGLTARQVHEIPPGSVLLIDNKTHTVTVKPCLPAVKIRQCVFERVYFSRGNDADVQQERLKMGKMLLEPVLNAVEHDIDNTYFSYIPNTANVSFLGLLEKGRFPRFGQLVVKDAKFRTFIADLDVRKKLNMHIYDLVYGVIRPGQDNIVLLDDSIVRGNTIEKLLLPLLDRLSSRKIVIASASPPLCYPDCYGIDMASLEELVAFRAAIAILQNTGRQHIIDSCYTAACADLQKTDAEMRNQVKPIYDAISFSELCVEIGRMLTPEGLQTRFEVVYQTLGNLRRCCPAHTGDWYFSGDYPTPGGNRVVNQALVNYINGNHQRAY